MGLFDFIKGQFIDVIEWVDYSRDTIAWKFPDQDKEIKMGAQLTVRESQRAILLNEGKMADVFEPGRYELTTRNMPLMTSLRSWKFGFESPFKADVYFCNTRTFTDNKWGTPSPVTIPDSKFGQVEFRSFGSYDFKVSNFELFFKQFMGTDPKVELEEVSGTLRGKLVDKFTEVVAQMAMQNMSFVMMQAQKSAFVEAMMPTIKAYFDGFGLEITNFSIQSITLPDEVNDFLRKNTQMNMVGDLQRFQQFQMANAMGNAGSGGGGMDAGMNMAGGMMMANAMMQNMQQMQQNTQAAAANTTAPSKDDIMKTLKDLADLKTAGILTEEEFAAKKAELLAKL